MAFHFHSILKTALTCLKYKSHQSLELFLLSILERTPFLVQLCLKRWGQKAVLGFANMVHSSCELQFPTFKVVVNVHIISQSV